MTSGGSENENMKIRSYFDGMFDEAVLAKVFKLAELVPDCYAEYRPLVMDGLLFFLERLSPLHLATILGEQMELPHGARSAQRLVAMFRQCPTLHKLGQVVSHDRRLVPELRQRLQGLESQKPTTRMNDIRDIVQRELGQIAGLEMAAQALAEASVAVVVPFVWKGTGTSKPQHGVFKILRPGIEDKLQEELEILSALGTFLEERCVHYRLPIFDFRNVLESVSRLLVNEIRFDREQVNLVQAARFYADSPDVLIPRLLPFSTPRITAMERVYGCKVTDSPDVPGERRQLAETIIDALLAKPFWFSADADASFHADPHAGNLFRTNDGRLAILDWALVTQLGKAQREAVIQMVLGALTLDDAKVCRAIATLGRVCDMDSLKNAVAEGLRQVRWGVFPSYQWITTLLDQLANDQAVQFPEEMILFRKSLLTISSVVADISGTPSIDEVVIKNGGIQFFQGLAYRSLLPMNSRGFGAHLSNEDFFGLWAGMPATAMRFWTHM
jgi:ubiquinone biosynthesis protein